MFVLTHGVVAAQTRSTSTSRISAAGSVHGPCNRHRRVEAMQPSTESVCVLSTHIQSLGTQDGAQGICLVAVAGSQARPVRPLRCVRATISVCSAVRTAGRAACRDFGRRVPATTPTRSRPTHVFSGSFCRRLRRRPEHGFMSDTVLQMTQTHKSASHRS